VTTCTAAGFPNSKQLGSPQNTNATDGNVSGVVTSHAAGGQEVNITILNPDVVIDAVIVKGGPAWNEYSDATHLPPTLLAPQHYISPFNGGTNIPDISHWFVCYHLTSTPPPTGSISVSKTVIGPNGGLLASLAAPTYSALVSCSDGSSQVVTFGGGGGQGTPTPALSGLVPNTTCTVVEQNPPSDAVVTYIPSGANTAPGVPITSTGPVSVTIVNDYSTAPELVGNLAVQKVLRNPDHLPSPASFTANVVCNDGKTNATVTMLPGGGPGTPILHPLVNFSCTLEEANVPAGWTVTYSVDGGPASSTLPIIPITSSTATVIVTITNDPGTTTTTTPPTTAPATTAPATTEPATSTTAAATTGVSGSDTGSTGSGALAFTGSRTFYPLLAGSLAVLVGFLLLSGSRWLSSKRPTPEHRKRRRPGRGPDT
jgi:hypothetical protein